MAAREFDSSKSAALARLYDVDLIEDPGDVELYLALAAQTGGPVLEIAAGSGRIAVAMAAAGFSVTAVDYDPSMLARAASASRAAGPDVESRLELVEADLLGLELSGGPRFHLAILALNSILLLGSMENQKAALETMARHLVPGGTAVVDVWLPNGAELAGYDGRVSLEYVREDPQTGNQIAKFASAQHEPATGHVDLTAIYEESGPDGAPRKWIRTDRLRLLNAGDLRFLAESSGLQVEVIAGNYNLDPVGPHDERAIVIARRRGGPASRD
jgi:ubiquinone/menaquinone biosynthesis C-methylase UbiE